MTPNEQRAHEFALMITKAFTDASFSTAKYSNADQINIDGDTSLNLYLASYKEALKRIEDN